MLLPAVVIVSLIVLATALGLLHQALTGRARQLSVSLALPREVVLGRDATLLQFSTEVCAPCKATHTVLDAVASESAGISHVDLDLTHRPDLASQFNILQTPTTLILDASGTVRARIGGAAKRATVLAELDRILLPAA